MTAGILQVTEQVSRRIDAKAVSIEFKMEGSNFILGQVAMKRCAELESLVQAIKSHGVTDDDIDVLSVKLKQHKGYFTKSSAAEYKLSVRIDDLGMIADVLGAIQSADHVTLDRVKWDYGETQDVVRELCAQATDYAMKKARAIAEAAGHEIVRIRVAADHKDASFARFQVQEQLSDSIEADRMGTQAMRGRAYRAKPRSLDIGTSYTSSQEITQSVVLEVLIQPAPAEMAAAEAEPPSEPAG